MQRILEPELMEAAAQVKAYAEADFSVAHDQFIQLILRQVDAQGFQGIALDLGCGPGDITRRFLNAFCYCKVDALDGSKAMLDFANLLLSNKLQSRVDFIHSVLPDAQLPHSNYDLIFSNSLLHHLADAQVLWRSIKKFGRQGTQVFIMDLLRPATLLEAKAMVADYASDEPEILQRDFYCSLLAAFTLEEVDQQLQTAQLHFDVEQISARHVFISGTL